jgi:hypothetical protein
MKENDEYASINFFSDPAPNQDVEPNFIPYPRRQKVTDLMILP